MNLRMLGDDENLLGRGESANAGAEIVEAGGATVISIAQFTTRNLLQACASVGARGSRLSNLEEVHGLAMTESRFKSPYQVSAILCLSTWGR